VLLWFAGVSFAFVWIVFRSPALDYRLIMVGSVVPLVEIVLGGPRLLHTLVFTVVLLGAVMLATRERRLVRRRWISLPIGVMMHLVLDGVWAQTVVFWWPFFGLSFGTEPLPELDHGLVVPLVLEAVGAAALAWCWFTFGLRDEANRRTFLQTGHLPRDLATS
jgi:hypothetical protein